MEAAPAPRQFSSARAALLWYVAQLAARLRVNRDLADVSVRRSAEERERVAVTFAAIARCLKPRHESDTADDRRYPLHGHLLVWLVAWYEDADYADGRGLSDRAGMTREAFDVRCRRTERELRERLGWAGLLDDDAEEAQPARRWCPQCHFRRTRREVCVVCVERRAA